MRSDVGSGSGSATRGGKALYLKRIEIHGFKSFADRTRIDFPAGITAVVGPNGSGKSNVVDAIRWVLGEQSARSLRGHEMQDVIFSGTTTRPPLGYAEVTLLFDNRSQIFPVPHAEVGITRRLYRSGESEYLMNQNACRLRDIQELLMDSGIGKRAHVIIEQGKIEEVVTANPEKRRQIFEEAAGIAKYRARREEAARKLDLAETNLSRLRDVLAELESRETVLKRQATQAERFLEAKEELRTLASLSARVRFRDLAARRDALAGEIASAEAEKAQAEAALVEVEAALEAAATSEAEGESSARGDREAARAAAEARAAADGEIRIHETRLVSMTEETVRGKARFETESARVVSAEREWETAQEAAGAAQAEVLRAEAEAERAGFASEEASRAAEEATFRARDAALRAAADAKSIADAAVAAAVAAESALRASGQILREAESKLGAARAVRVAAERSRASGRALREALGAGAFVDEAAAAILSDAEIRAALLGRLAAILWPHAEIGSEASDRIREAGDVFEVILPSASAAPSVAGPDGAPSLAERVEDGPHAGALRALLARTFAAPSLEWALARRGALAQGARFATAQGDIVSSDGVLFCASHVPAAEVPAIAQNEEAAASARRDESAAALAAAESEAVAAREAARRAEVEAARAASEASSSARAPEAASAREESSRKAAVAREARSRCEVARARLAETRRRAEETARSARESETRARAESDRLIEIAGILASAAADRANLDARREAAHAAVVAADEKVASAETRLAELRAARASAETRARTFRASREAAAERHHAAARESAGTEAEAKALAENHRVNFEEDLLPADSDATLPEGAEERLANLRARLARSGAVNFQAAEELREIASRLEVARAEDADLSRAVEDLRTVIVRMDDETRKVFLETFQAVATNFSVLFQRLFEGGEAEVILLDPENPLTSGVEIVARPPGKKPQSISLLSGGEKAMTAIGLLFAVFLVRPSPFSVLDELDAPLDEANIGRYTRLLHEFAKKTQFLIITHNKSTMEMAETLYGVTQEEKGVSKVLSVTLSEAEESVRVEQAG